MLMRLARAIRNIPLAVIAAACSLCAHAGDLKKLDAFVRLREIEVLVRVPKDTCWNPALIESLEKFGQQLAAQPGVALVQSPAAEWMKGFRFIRTRHPELKLDSEQGRNTLGSLTTDVQKYQWKLLNDDCTEFRFRLASKDSFKLLPLDTPGATSREASLLAPPALVSAAQGQVEAFNLEHASSGLTAAIAPDPFLRKAFIIARSDGGSVMEPDFIRNFIGSNKGDPSAWSEWERDMGASVFNSARLVADERWWPGYSFVDLQACINGATSKPAETECLSKHLEEASGAATYVSPDRKSMLLLADQDIREAAQDKTFDPLCAALDVGSILQFLDEHEDRGAKAPGSKPAVHVPDGAVVRGFLLYSPQSLEILRGAQARIAEGKARLSSEKSAPGLWALGVGNQACVPELAEAAYNQIVKEYKETPDARRAAVRLASRELWKSP